MEYFCPHCGIQTKDNTHIGTISGDKILLCPVCNFCMRFNILPSTLKTEKEIDTAFQDTKLTESQEYGSKSKYGRKRNKQK